MFLKRYWSLGLLVLTVLIRGYFSAVVGLGDDEAYYWEWSRHFQLSYFDHPPMVAWLIRMSTKIFGSTPLGVRFFALICSGVSGALIFVLARRLWSESVANLSLFIYLVTPLYAVGSFLMVPDAPLGCAWMLACLGLERILLEGRDEWRKWILLGLVMGLGLLSKYPIAVLGLSAILLALTEARWRRQLLSAKFFLSVLIFVFCIFPLVEWNYQHDWQSFQFQFANRFRGTSPFRLSRTLEFTASQMATLGPVLFFAYIATAVLALRRWQDLRWRFLACLSLPLFCIFAIQSAFSDFKPHWPAPAYPLFIIGLSAWMMEWKATLRRTVLAVQLGLVFPLVVLFHVGTIVPVIPSVVKMVLPGIEWQPKFDPTNDLYGWDEVGRDAVTLADDLARTRPQRPFISSERYQIVAQLAFALQSDVYRVLEDVDNYSFSQEQVLSLLVGRDTIFVSDGRFPRDPHDQDRFATCDPIKKTTVYRGSQVAREFQIWFCTDYRGIYQLLRYNPSHGRHAGSHRSPAQRLVLLASP